MIATVDEVGPKLGVAPTCAALGLSRETYYRRQRPKGECQANCVTDKSGRAEFI